MTTIRIDLDIRLLQAIREGDLRAKRSAFAVDVCGEVGRDGIELRKESIKRGLGRTFVHALG